MTNNIKLIKTKNGNNNINKDDIKNINTENNNNNIIQKNKLYKYSTKKRILKTKTEFVRIKALHKQKENSENTNINNLININKYLHSSINSSILNTEANEYFSNSLLSNSTKIKKNRKKIFSNISEFDTVIPTKTMIKIKSNQPKLKTSIKDLDLNLYKGDINYNNVSTKNFEESLNDLMIKYKKKGYTCVKKNKSKFKFVKGPNIHNVEIMRLGNGLLYFNVMKN